MASSGFPQRKSQGAGGMTSPAAGTEQLDGPPPSPMMGGVQQMQPGAQAPMPSFAQMAKPMTAGSPGRATPPEIVMGIMQTVTTVYGIFDSIASIVPDLGADMALQKDLLQQAMAKLVVNSGQVGNPAAPGQSFPGGGFASGTP